MKFIVDESTGMAVAEYLRTIGHDVIAVSEVMPRADDQNILFEAAREGRVLITNDKDFGELVFRRGKLHHGVLLLRLKDETSSNRVRVVKGILDQHADVLENHFIIATEKHVRIREVQGILE